MRDPHYMIKLLNRFYTKASHAPWQIRLFRVYDSVPIVYDQSNTERKNVLMVSLFLVNNPVPEFNDHLYSVTLVRKVSEEPTSRIQLRGHACRGQHVANLWVVVLQK